MGISKYGKLAPRWITCAGMWLSAHGRALADDAPAAAPVSPTSVGGAYLFGLAVGAIVYALVWALRERKEQTESAD